MLSFEIINLIIDSWKTCDGVNSISQLHEWITYHNENTFVKIEETTLDDNGFWFYDNENGVIKNRNNSFFTVSGIECTGNDKIVKQPIIIQSEIGYLGIICKVIDGVLHFLMQAKIEPGNINCVQISPTIQATKSNFTQKHGGKAPAYLDYFLNSSDYNIIYDQIQSEQSSRFYKKRNRNVIIMVENEIDVVGNFRWMTLGQIKKLMKEDNLVNMDTRTVLSGIPFSSFSLSDSEKQIISDKFCDKSLYRSIFCVQPSDELSLVMNKINNYKMFCDHSRELISLDRLDNWTMDQTGVVCKDNADFMVRYYDIEIEGREVKRWSQPLFKAVGIATFGLVTKVEDGVRKFLIKIMPEIGCFDNAELGPSVQWEPTHKGDKNDVERLFVQKLESRENILFDTMLSEEGGRFYHEQNRNVIIEITDDELTQLPDNYSWVTFDTLNFIMQVNNVLNIQLRNLLSLLDI